MIYKYKLLHTIIPQIPPELCCWNRPDSLGARENSTLWRLRQVEKHSSASWQHSFLHSTTPNAWMLPPNMQTREETEPWNWNRCLLQGGFFRWRCRPPKKGGKASCNSSSPTWMEKLLLLCEAWGRNRYPGGKFREVRSENRAVKL